MFNYDKSGGKAVAKRLLAGFEGRYFQCEGYAGYDEACREKQVVHLALRVGRDIIAPAPHRSGRARLTHPVPHEADLLIAA